MLLVLVGVDILVIYFDNYFREVQAEVTLENLVLTFVREKT